MATPHWIGANLGVWNSTANWSLTQNGAGGAAVPVAGDTVYIDKTIASEQGINVNQSIGNINTLDVTGPSGIGWFFAGTAGGTAGTAWSLSAPVTINVNGNTYLSYRNSITPSGAAKIVKTGTGSFGADAIASTSFGALPIDLNQGSIFTSAANNKLGTGLITMQASTGLYNNSTTTVYSIANPIDVQGNINLGGTGFSSLTLGGSVAFGATNKTVTVLSSGAIISGAITGTAGFTKAGTGTLQITSGPNAGLTGTLTIDATAGASRIWLGTLNTAGTPNGLSGISSINFTNVASGYDFSYWGLSAYTEDASFTTNNVATQIFVGNPGGVTFTPAVAGGISNFTGRFFAYTDDGASLTSSTITYNEFPTSAANLSFFANQTTNTTKTHTHVFNVGGTTAANVDIRTGSATAAGYICAFNNNAGASPVVISGAVTKTVTSNTGTLRLLGSGASGTLSGIISNGLGTLNLEKQGTGGWVLSNANTYTGANTVSAGTLVANNNAALGAASGTASSITTGATLEIGSGITVNKSSTQWTLNGNTAANGAVYASSGNAGLTAANFVLGTATSDIKADAGATLTLTSAGAISGNFILRHIGAGTAVLAQTAASTFTALNIQSGTVSVSAALAAGGVSSGIGNGSTAASNWLIGSTATAGTFRYTGAASSTNRNFTIGTAGSTFDASGSGVLTLTGTTPAFSAANTACTLTLAGTAGTSATPNTSAMVLPDNTQPVGLTKTGTGAWKFTASQTYTGATTITGGSMSFGETNIATNVVFNGPGILREVVLNGVSKTITCSAGASDVAELIATSSHNTITGSTNITTGTLKLTTEATAATKPVKVLGDTNVSVTGKLQTSTGTLQRGQMRYGGDLTFQAGSTFIIGG